MHGSLPLSFCASMFDYVFGAVIYVVLLVTSLTASLTIIFPLGGKIHIHLIFNNSLISDSMRSLQRTALNMHFNFFVQNFRGCKKTQHIPCFREEVVGFRIYVVKQGIYNTASIKRQAKTHRQTHTHIWDFKPQQVSSVIFNIIDGRIQMLFLSVWWTE